MEEVSLFFSWQSDRPEIRSAIFTELKKVEKQLAKDDIKLVVDQDARGRKTADKIEKEVLNKIKNCDLFLADVSPVVITEKEIDEDIRRTKLLPNPNVMYEYGYASGVKDMNCVITVANLKKGEFAEQLPFDINHDTIAIFSIEDGKLLSLYNLIKSKSEYVIEERKNRIKEHECFVCWNENGEPQMSITIHPKYRRISYIPRVVIPTSYGMSFNGNKVSEIKIANLWSSQTDHSYCPLRLIVANTGEKVLENLHVSLESTEASVEFATKNTETQVPTLRLSKNYIMPDSHHLRLKTPDLNPNSWYEGMDEFYVKVPAKMGSVILKWSIQSKDYRQEGTLEIINQPEYIDETVESDTIIEPERIEPYIERESY